MDVHRATDLQGTTERVQGYLFSDLRGYTSFVEREGDQVAAELLERYRGLVRRALDEAGGAEIRTEGDSFYATFSSAGPAVRAGLAIAQAASEATARDPRHPILPGIGVHVGEAAQGAEGPVGSAVNLAARLCAAAAPGEVLVSGTVRDLLRTSGSFAFEARGRRSLKGIAEPIETWSARARESVAAGERPGTEPRRRRITRPAGAHPAAASRQRPGFRGLAAIAGLAALLLAGVVLAQSLGRPGPSAPALPGSLDAGIVAARSGAPGTTSPQATPSAEPVASPAPGVFPDAVEAEILAALPPDVKQTCRRGGTVDDAVLAGFVGELRQKAYGGNPAQVIPITPDVPLGGVTCRPATGAARLYVMAYGTGSASSGSASFYLGQLTSFYHLTLGSCATGHAALESWTSPSGSGELACRPSFDGRPWIYFTFGSGRYLAFATRDDTDYLKLQQWWEQLKTFLS